MNGASWILGTLQQYTVKPRIIAALPGWNHITAVLGPKWIPRIHKNNMKKSFKAWLPCVANDRRKVRQVTWRKSRLRLNCRDQVNPAWDIARQQDKSIFRRRLAKQLHKPIPSTLMHLLTHPGLRAVHQRWLNAHDWNQAYLVPRVHNRVKSPRSLNRETMLRRHLISSGWSFYWWPTLTGSLKTRRFSCSWDGLRDVSLTWSRVLKARSFKAPPTETVQSFLTMLMKRLSSGWKA